MPWLRVDIDIASGVAESVENICLALGAVAVTLVDQHDDPVLEPAPGEIRLWPSTCLQALFAAEGSALPDPATLLAALQSQTALEPHRFRHQFIEDRIWEREWLRDFRPMAFGQRLWIVPGEWATPAQAQVVVRLDPGLAFGTGTHPTTAMCLRWLDAELDTQATMIDYGCGSGILAVSALALGARQAQAFDIDPQALLATRENAVRNHVQERLRVFAQARDLQPAQIVVANILAGPLIELAPVLCELVRPGGKLVLAGLLAAQSEEIRAAYTPWLNLQQACQVDDWVLLAGQRPANPAQFRP